MPGIIWNAIVKLTSLLLIIALGVVGLYAYDKFEGKQSSPPPEPARPAAPAASQFDRPWGQGSGGSPSVASPPSVPSSPPMANPLPVASSTSYKCDGRTHCSQMRSCAEAKHFIRHCPNTRMDGDHDGIPCERQWCN